MKPVNAIHLLIKCLRSRCNIICTYVKPLITQKFYIGLDEKESKSSGTYFIPLPKKIGSTSEYNKRKKFNKFYKNLDLPRFLTNEGPLKKLQIIR